MSIFYFIVGCVLGYFAFEPIRKYRLFSRIKKQLKAAVDGPQFQVWNEKRNLFVSDLSLWVNAFDVNDVMLTEITKNVDNDVPYAFPTDNAAARIAEFASKKFAYRKEKFVVVKK